MSSQRDSRLLSHAEVQKDIDLVMDEKIQAILAAGDKPYVTAERQIEILHQLEQTDLGQFLLLNKGLNGYWTHYILTYPWQKDAKPQNDLEKFILESAPIALATQERFRIFLAENQKSVANTKRLACLPSGLMGELLYLDFAGITDIQLIGIV